MRQILMLNNFTIVFLFVSLKICYCARILAIFPFGSRSIHGFTLPIMKTVAANGHDVTFMSQFKIEEQTANFTGIQFRDEKMPFHNDSTLIDKVKEFNGIFQFTSKLYYVGLGTCEATLRQEFIRGLLKSNNEKAPPVDLLIVESYFAFCYTLLAQKFNIPLISISSTSTFHSNDFFVGNTNNPAIVPLLTYDVTTRMNLAQRISNTLQYLFYYIQHYTVFYSYLQEMADKYMDKMKVQSIADLQKRIVLSMKNNHHSYMSTPSSPNTVNIAGIHIKDLKPLPKDIKEIFDNAKNGVIFFSFGSSIKASSMSTEKLNMFVNVFSKIPQRVLWRVDDPRLVALPPNVNVSKWFPQRDILEHKNLKAFISHCGMFSTYEAMHTGTPVIAIPFLFDQLQDAKIMVEKGVAIELDYQSLTEERLAKAIHEILNNPSYSENASKLSMIFRDRLVKPMDEVLYWIDYVIRHKGAPTLRTTGADLPLYQYLLLDVFTIIIIGISLSLYIVKLIIGLIFRTIANLLFGKKSPEKHKKL